MTDVSTSLSWRKMAAPVGAVVSGLDVRTIDNDVWSELDALFVEHHVLVFPEQELSAADQIAFASRWGFARAPSVCRYGGARGDHRASQQGPPSRRESALALGYDI